MQAKFSSILALLIALAGCSNLPPARETSTVPEENQVQESANTSPASAVKAPVLKTLVQGAALISRHEAFTPPETESIEEKIEQVLPVIPMTPNRVVEQAINNNLQNRRTLARIWAERSQLYFPMIERIFDEEDVPDELKYIAVGESGLNPLARSSAGAVGMWQFMAGTARSEGLRVDGWVDERLDPELSTRAAAKHIKKLNEAYNGRWHLTLAGYNCSYRCISRSVRNAGYSMDDPPSYWEVYAHLPNETRGFVPKFISNALVLSNPEQFGIPVENLGEELTYDVVHVKGMLSLEIAAKLAGTDLPTMRKLNPSLVRAIVPPDVESYPLKIPLDTYDIFVREFARIAPEATGNGEYIVKKGDTLSGIAGRHGISVAELQAANGISGHLINIDQKLIVPGQGDLNSIELLSTEREFVAYHPHTFKPIDLGDGFTLVHQSGSTEDNPLLAVSLNYNLIEDDEGAMSLVPTIYQVRSGDTLGMIAQRFGVSVSSIQSSNRLTGHLIYPDQELTIHSATNVPDAPRDRTYQVQRGDSLYQIAQRFGMTVDNLKQLNGLRGNLIHPGQNLLYR